MKINLETYELYVIDFLEGNLNSELKAEFNAFLLIHPEIKLEIEELNKFQLNDTSQPTFDNSFLKKDLFSETLVDENFEDLCIDYIERSFNNKDRKKFEIYISENPSKKKIFNQFKLTVLDKDFIKTHDNFKNLIKQIVLDEEDYIDEITIAYNENDLTKGEKLSLEEDCEIDSELKKQIKIYNKIVLKADKKIVFLNKEKLKQKDKLNLFIKYSLSIAASILFLILIPTNKILENKLNFSNNIALNITDSISLINTNYYNKYENDKEINKNKDSIIQKKITTTKIDKIKDTVIQNIIPAEELEFITSKSKLNKLEIPIYASNEIIKIKTDLPINLLINNNIAETLSEEKSLKLEKIKFWKVASFAVNLFSKATKSEVFLSSEYDKDGKLKSIDFVSSNFNYTKQYKRQ